jgi:hypothetical protein
VNLHHTAIQMVGDMVLIVESFFLEVLETA